MQILLWFCAAIVSYLIAGVNFSIILSGAWYHEDIRQKGSGNPGFTNFKRVYGTKPALVVFFLDFAKGVLPCLLFGFLFRHFGMGYEIGAAFAGLFAGIGHCFPVYYRFRGGKSVMVAFATLTCVHIPSAAIAFGVLILILLTVQYMSVGSMVSLIVGVISLLLFGTEWLAVVFFSLLVILMIVRHHENIRRLIKGEESRFSLSNN